MIHLEFEIKNLNLFFLKMKSYFNFSHTVRIKPIKTEKELK